MRKIANDSISDFIRFFHNNLWSGWKIRKETQAKTSTKKPVKVQIKSNKITPN